MKFRDAVRLRARKRLARELCRALESGLSDEEVRELLVIAQAHVDEGRRR